MERGQEQSARAARRIAENLHGVDLAAGGMTIGRSPRVRESADQMMRDHAATHPEDPYETRAAPQPRRTVGGTAVDLSAGASTIGRDGMTIGEESRRQAVKSAFEATHTSGASLLEAWRRYQEVQPQRETGPDAERRAAKRIASARHASALAGPALEERALRKGRRKMLKTLKAGGDASTARVKGYRHYVKHGGKLSPAGFSRKVVAS